MSYSSADNMSKTETKKKKPQKGTNQNIQVFVRIKPEDRQETGRFSLNVVECPSSKEIVVKDRSPHISAKTFSFDHVFEAKSNQIDIYRRVVHPLMEEVRASYNCTVFAYGQTGTGKTYTMEGERSENPSIFWEEEYTEEIERLRKDLAATQEKNGVYMDHEEYLKLNTKVSALEKENSEKYANIKALQEEMEKMDELCSTLNLEVDEKQKELIQKTEFLLDAKDCLEKTKSILQTTEKEKAIQEHLVNYYVEKEKELNEQAISVMRAADMSTLDASQLHDKLSRKRSFEEGNKNRGGQFRDKFRRNVSQMEDSLDQMVLEHSQFCANLRTSLGETPPRRDDKYPRKLTVSSPREVVIKRFQAQLNPEEMLKSVLEDQVHEKRGVPKFSSSQSLPDVEDKSLLDQLPKHGLFTAGGESNFPSEVVQSNLEDKLENQENLKITRKVKSHLKEPRVITKLQGPLYEKNEG